MSKRVFSMVGLFILMAFMFSMLTAAAPLPNTTFTFMQCLPTTLKVGETYTVSVQVGSDQEFISALALPSFQFPGKGVVAVQGGDHSGRGTSAILEITFQAKSSTAEFPGGVAPVFVVAGVRYVGGYIAVQECVFNVTVP